MSDFYLITLKFEVVLVCRSQCLWQRGRERCALVLFAEHKLVECSAGEEDSVLHL